MAADDGAGARYDRADPALALARLAERCQQKGACLQRIVDGAPVCGDYFADKDSARFCDHMGEKPVIKNSRTYISCNYRGKNGK